MPGYQWARSLTVDSSDLDYLTNLLLDRETPLSTEELALALVDERLRREAAELTERFKDVRVYNPAHSYEIGQRLAFSALNYSTAVVVGSRPGNNPQYGDFAVISVEFEGESGESREFAANLKAPHKLSLQDNNGANILTDKSAVTPEQLLRENREQILTAVESMLVESPNLVRLANKWFPRELIMEVNQGHLNLAEAVLDLADDEPLPSSAILEQIGGLGTAPQDLQIFSLNFALNQDPRFDEVGPAGEVLWYLARFEPPEVLQTPAMLRYRPVIEYDRSLLTEDMLTLELEIGDELSPLAVEEDIDEATITLNYPHRRVGTLPINHKTHTIFPTARRAPRIWVTLLDEQDDEEFVGWVVHNEGYVYGLGPIYRKHKLPVGAYISVSRSDTPGQVIVNFEAYRPRTEWIRLIVPKDGQLHFENHRRAIGSEYDELMILGVDDIPAVDALFQATAQQKKHLASILKGLIPELGRLSPQGTVHAKTLYSAVNVVRRCPPGPILATLIANPDFQNVGGHYWKLTE